MGEIAQRVSWTVSVRSGTHREIERACDDLVEACRGLLAEAFPAAAGYETATYRLSGPIEGARLVVARGRFCATISAQRFVRSHGATGPGAPPVEVRLIATVEIAPPPPEPTSFAIARRDGASLQSWSVVLGLLGTVGFSALALGAAGLLSVWVQMLLLIPALVAWRAAVNLALASSHMSLPRPAIAPASPPRRDPVVRDALVRWHRIAGSLQAQRERFDEAARLPPFRSQPRPLSAAS